MRSRPISGAWLRASALLLTLALTACNYGFRGGGGLPGHVQTIYIAAFENRTNEPELDPLVNRALREGMEQVSGLPRALGLREAGERNADLIVRGTILRYDDQASSYRPGERGDVDVDRHQVQITIGIQLVDVRDNVIRYESQSVMGRGEYSLSSQSPEVARRLALQQIIQQIVDGAQSQW